MVNLVFQFPNFSENYKKRFDEFERYYGQHQSCGNLKYELPRLHCDFLRETALSFGVGLILIHDVEYVDRYFTGNPKPVVLNDYKQLTGKNVILTTDDSAIKINDYDWSSDDLNLVLGADDGQSDPDVEGDKVYIPTPTDYPLWSAVAAGIVLHHKYMNISR